MSALDRIAEIRAAGEAAVAAAADTAALEDVRVAYLGRRAELPQLLRSVAELPPEQRSAVGSGANAARQALEALVKAREQELAAGELDTQLLQERIDLTLPPVPAFAPGHLHLLTQTRRDIEDVFVGLGFAIAEGPEVELTSLNFDALNTAATHPSRARSDSFYVSDEVVLRTHTSPVQVRSMMASPPPLYVIAPGRVFRIDNDATHTPQFHQVEGLAVDEGITLADLKGTLLAFARAIFGDQREVQLRPDFFPFTEPSVEVDVSCFNCDHGHLRDGSRCPLCKGSGWLEILGAGMVDPNVFAYVREYGYDPDVVTGFAFGMGIERIAMLRHGVPDLRLYFDNDIRFLEQFGEPLMLVPLEWLRHYCDPELGTEELASLLTLHGVKTERWFRYGVPERDHYVVGRVLEAIQHPNADRLRVCTVELGEGEPATIVCGAPNVAAGQTVAVARPGAKLPDGRTLGAAKLRGVVSEGMILATDEIALGGDHAGILVLDDGPAPGTPLGEVLPLGTDVLELEITPNRPDCLAVYGVAREVHAMTGAALAPPPWSADPGTLEGEPPGASISVECPELCPRFTARVFEDVTVAPSPLWLAARLLAAGMRPISNVVDITNYVMLLTGQPLHAFDLDRVAGASLTVRRALDGETIETLDGVTRTLDSEMVVICDADGPTSIAGIMGGGRSEVHDATSRILLEAATWVGANVQRSAVRLGLRSEASGRFEKGLSRLSPIEGQIVASILFAELCSATVVAGTIDVGGPGETPPLLTLRPERVREVLGAEIPAQRCAEILASLGFGVDAALQVEVPHWRGGDVTREIDLIEEVARIDGLARLPATLPPRRGVAARLTHAQRLARRVEDALAARGASEIVGWSFADPAVLDRLRLGPDDPMRAVVTIENPLSEAQSILRPTLLCSLLDAASRNVARGARDLALFESGTVYRAAQSGPQADEHHGLSLLLTGEVIAPAWRGEPAPGDFHAAKGLLAAVLDVAGIEWELSPRQWPFLHPARSAAVLSGEQRLGFIGELHPLVAAAWDLERVAVWALDVGRLAELAPELAVFSPFGEYPPAHEDLAVVVGDDVAAGDVTAAIRAAGGPALAAVSLFDVYRGPQVGEAKQSLAFHLEFRSLERTLSSEEIAPLREKIAAALAERFGGTLRA